MISLILQWLAVACIALIVCQPGTTSMEERKDKAMAENTQSVLTNSMDSNKLHAAAASLLKSPKAEDHATLLKFLSKKDFLSRLDSAKDYEQGSKYLRIARLIKEMRASLTPGIRQLLVELMQQKEFIANETRVELLIWASVVLRPAPPTVVKFWDDHCQPDDSFAALVTKALVDNGSVPAIELLEKKLSAPQFEDDERIWWMRTAILTHRQDVLVLKACRRLLEKALPPSLQQELVAVLFDYRPDEWHGPDGTYPPPPETQASEEARQLLRVIGEYALTNVKLNERLQKIVRAKVEALKKARSQ
jgi:hypothetical protein